MPFGEVHEVHRTASLVVYTHVAVSYRFIAPRRSFALLGMTVAR